MPRTIRISDATWERLKAWARPLEDSADDVVSRILDRAGDPPVARTSVLQPTAPVDGASTVHEKPRGAKSGDTIPLLVARGMLEAGEELVVAPSRLPPRADPGDLTFRARLSNAPDARDNIIWALDGQSYAISRLTKKIRDEHQVSVNKSEVNGNMYWCRAADPSRTLWELREAAERLGIASSELKAALETP